MTTLSDKLKKYNEKIEATRHGEFVDFGSKNTKVKKVIALTKIDYKDFYKIYFNNISNTPLPDPDSYSDGSVFIVYNALIGKKYSWEAIVQ